jgi:mRNA interferase MazF
VRRGEVWSCADGRKVLVVSLDALHDQYEACLAIVLHDVGKFGDTAMSVVLDAPVPSVAVAFNLAQFRAARFDGGTCHGTVGADAMARVDAALRAVLDL